MRLTAEARLDTTEGSRYLKQLCRHWGHRFDVDFDDERGTIRFGGSACDLIAEPTTLIVRVHAADAEQVIALGGVVADHLARFAFREQLSFTWSAPFAAGSH